MSQLPPATPPPHPQLLFQIITLTILWHMPAEQLPATVYIMSFIRFIVGINVCKSRAQLAPCEFASKYRLFFCTAYLQAYNKVQKRGSFEWGIEDVGFLLPVNLCLNSEMLICGVDSLHGGFSALRSWASLLRELSGVSLRFAEICFQRKECVFYIPGFDHLGSIAALASRISI